MNPSIFTVEDNESDKVIRLAKDSDDLIFIRSLLQKYRVLYASYFRPGECWEAPVFVCPKCVHATLEDGEPEEFHNEFYCKYCHTEWRHDATGWHNDDSKDNEEEADDQSTT